jgi:hypothetical protein
MTTTAAAEALWQALLVKDSLACREILERVPATGAEAEAVAGFAVAGLSLVDLAAWAGLADVVALLAPRMRKRTASAVEIAAYAGHTACLRELIRAGFPFRRDHQEETEAAVMACRRTAATALSVATKRATLSPDLLTVSVDYWGFESVCAP